MELNYDFINSHRLLILQHTSVEFWVVGMGGTGSWLSASVVRLARTLTNAGKLVRVYFVVNAQSLSINQRVTAEATDYLLGLTTGNLRRFATYFDLASGSTRSLYLTETAVFNATSSPKQ